MKLLRLGCADHFCGENKMMNGNGKWPEENWIIRKKAENIRNETFFESKDIVVEANETFSLSFYHRRSIQHLPSILFIHPLTTCFHHSMIDQQNLLPISLFYLCLGDSKKKIRNSFLNHLSLLFSYLNIISPCKRIPRVNRTG